MTKAEIERMARSAGLFVPIKGIPENGALIRFFHAAYAAGAESERESCAQLCEQHRDMCQPKGTLATMLATNIAAIRSRSNA